MHLPGRANAYPNLLEKRNAAKDNVGFVSGDADTTPSDFGIPPRTFVVIVVVVVKEVVLFPSVLFLSPPLAALAMAFATVSSFLSASKIASYTPCDLSQSFSCSCSFSSVLPLAQPSPPLLRSVLLHPLGQGRKSPQQ